MVGNFVFGLLADKVGRKPAVFLGTGVTAVFGLASAFSPGGDFGLAMLITTRFICGLGIGGAGVAFTMFSEVVPPSSRGQQMLNIELWWTAGTLTVTGLAWAVKDTWGWRVFVGLSTIPSFAMLLFWPWVDESPRFLAVTQQWDRVEAYVDKVAFRNKKRRPTGGIRLPPEQPRGQVWELFQRGLRRTTVLLWVIWFMNGFSYFGFILFTPGIFGGEDPCAELSNSSSSSSSTSYAAVVDHQLYISVGLTSAAELPGLASAMLLINRVGRKWSQAILFSCAAVAQFVLLSSPLVNNMYFDLAFAMISRMCIHGGFSCTWVYTPEVYPSPLRATGVGSASSIQKGASIITPYISRLLQVWNCLLPLGAFAAGNLVAAGCSLALKVCPPMTRRLRQRARHCLTLWQTSWTTTRGQSLMPSLKLLATRPGPRCPSRAARIVPALV